ncbi:NPP1 family protein, partial [Actinoplanes sp. NPDC051633]|uniref:NPP1 family protein n=1 Tax=Actinoplanes sp. NPDC051633 TaxID=3155670 RepID=UPI003438E5F1
MTASVPPERALVLLRRFEPVVRFTAGELFLPSPVDDFVAGSALVRGGHKTSTELAPAGSLGLDSLAELGRRHAADALSLRRVADPLNSKAYRSWRRSRPPFRASSRFAVVGLPSRLVDAGVRLTLILRGTVPGGFTAAAHRAYACSDQTPTYYGRAMRDGGYLVLQYWFYYWMNDWRSSFGGVNDHEGDWEQVTIFLTDAEAAPTPRWVAYSAHDTVGDDLRRRWDDPDLTMVGE